MSSPPAWLGVRVWTGTTCDCKPPTGHYWSGKALLVNGAPCPSWRPQVYATGALESSPWPRGRDEIVEDPPIVIVEHARPLDAGDTVPARAKAFLPHARRVLVSRIAVGEVVTRCTHFIGVRDGHWWTATYLDTRFDVGTWDRRPTAGVTVLLKAVRDGGVPKLQATADAEQAAKTKGKPAARRAKSAEHLA